MTKKIVSHILRTLFGLIFVYSAYSKLFAIDNFELFIFGNGISNWDIASTFARLIISTELFIGIMLLINIYTKRILQINLVILALFSVLMVYFIIFKDNITNCNCFGEEIKFTPIESLLKNVIFIVINIFLLKFLFPFRLKYKKIITTVLFLSSFSVPVILSPPDYIYPVKSTIINKPFDFSLIGDFHVDNNTRVPVVKGKKLICYFSEHCKFCKLAAKKLTIIEKNTGMELPVYYIFFGDNKDDLTQFWEESESKKYPCQIIHPEQFFAQSGSSLPAIFFVNDSIIEKKSGFRTLNQEEIYEFFKEK